MVKTRSFAPLRPHRRGPAGRVQQRSGLSNDPRATLSQIGCLDYNGDNVLNDADAADESKVPDFNGDRKHDDQRRRVPPRAQYPARPEARTSGVRKGSDNEPEYLVAHGYFSPSNVSCGGDKKPVLLVGVGGGVVNLKTEGRRGRHARHRRRAAEGVRRQRHRDDRRDRRPGDRGRREHPWRDGAVADACGAGVSRPIPVPARGDRRPQPRRRHGRRRRSAPRGPVRVTDHRGGRC